MLCSLFIAHLSILLFVWISYPHAKCWWFNAEYECWFKIIVSITSCIRFECGTKRQRERERVSGGFCFEPLRSIVRMQNVYCSIVIQWFYHVQYQRITNSMRRFQKPVYLQQLQFKSGYIEWSDRLCQIEDETIFTI